jgi:hypothetical protein
MSKCLFLFRSLKNVKDYSWRTHLSRKIPLANSLLVFCTPNFNHYTNVSFYRVIKIISRYCPFKMSFSACNGPDAGR